MLESLKERVCVANLELASRGMVVYTWGNVSGVDRERGLVVIKPSGVEYGSMCADDMVVVDLETGATVEGEWRPSSDTRTHLELYRCFPRIGGVTHTHSVNAVSFAQAGMDVPALGTTHADYFYGAIPCTRELTQDEVMADYELSTGKVIVECFKDRGLDANAVPGVLVRNHGPFTWGNSPELSVCHAVALDIVCEMALKTLRLNKSAHLAQYVLDKHYMRKHGPKAYYGQ